jgi:antitoxin (DNA-binding transcriptional repressor) of toxin-antitoxin stability system
MATAIDIRELPTRLEEALALVSAGQEVILLDGSTPRARLVPLGPVPSPRTPGLHPGALQPAPDFDAPLPDDFWAGQS